MSKDLILGFDEYDLNHVIADQEAIRRINPQRYEMEQLTAVVYEDVSRHICAGYKDVTDDEFWVRGHMPGSPLMPGVVMCEAAAQLCSYYTIKNNLLGVDMVGFGGLEGVRFRDPVRPGDRLVIVARQLRLRKGAMCVCEFQCFVDKSLVCEGQIKGIPLSSDLLAGTKSHQS